MKKRKQAHSFDDSLVAELFYAINCCPDDKFQVIIVAEEGDYHTREFLVTRPLHPSYQLKNYAEYSNDEIRYYSPVRISMTSSGGKGEVLEISHLHFVNFNGKLQITAGNSRFVRFDYSGIEKISRMLTNVITNWITMDIETIWKGNHNNNLHDGQVIENRKLLEKLPNEIKYEIISFIPTYSKPERIKMMERNVGLICEQLHISRDEFYDKHCDECCNTRLIEKKLNPICLKRLDNEFITLLKMRLINREYARMMKKRILKLDTLYIYDNDFGNRLFVRASLELSAKEFRKNPNNDSLYILHPKISRKILCLSNYSYSINIRCAPIMNDISSIYSIIPLPQLGIRQKLIEVMGRVDFCNIRQELKIYRPTVMLNEVEELRYFFRKKLDLYCLYVDERIIFKLIEQFDDSESYQITLHKRDFCKRIIKKKFGEEESTELNIYELNEYHPLMFSQMTTDSRFYNLDLLNMKKMLDSVYKHGHDLFEIYSDDVNYLQKSVQAPTFLQPYTNYLRSTFQTITLNFKPCYSIDFEPSNDTENYRALDVIRNSLFLPKYEEFDLQQDLLKKALPIFLESENLTSYFFRPFFSGIGYQLFSFIRRSGFAIEYMEETELAYQDETGSTVLHHFARDSLDLEIDDVEEIFQYFPNLLSICNNQGLTPVELVGHGQKIISQFMDEYEIVIDEKCYRINPYERPQKKQKRIDSYLK